ncbi:hypothetical protein ACFLRC_02350 [Candidatus Altiarchaeota archaeon]
MKIHILSVGFTPDIFTNAKTSPLITKGADKIIAIHSSNLSPENKQKVEKTIEALSNFTGIPLQLHIIDDTSFANVVIELTQIINEYEGEEVYIHITAGERHISSALFYAASFSETNSKIVVINRYKEDIDLQNYFLLPRIPVYNKISQHQSQILNDLKENGESRLIEIVKRTSDTSEKEDIRRRSPGTFAHLKRLTNLGFISFDDFSKEYQITTTGRILLAR